jgi:hypothetical protein
MRKIVISVIVALLVGGAASYGISQYLARKSQQDLVARLHTVEQTLSQTKKELIGFTRYTDYLSTTKKAMAEQSKFLAAAVDREYVHVEHIERSKFWVKSDATIILKYAVEYSVGFDLRPDSFAVGADESGIVVTIGRPQLVASPSIRIISHEIPDKGAMIDEKTAVIQLQQQLNEIAKSKGQEIVREDAVVALCEKKLAAFLQDFLSRQANIKVVPAVRFSYR